MAKLENTKTLQYEILSWKDIKNEIKHHNPVFFKLVEAINPPKQLKLIKATYLYGQIIVDEGRINIPNQKYELVSIANPQFPKELRNLLDYSPIPLGMLLNKSSEVYVEANERVVPLNVLDPGSFFGLFETLSVLAQCSSTSIWSVCAGARSAFMVPRITDANCHRRLRKELNLTLGVPKTPAEHCDIFSQINLLQPEDKQWKSQVVYFTKEWIDLLKNDAAWKDLQIYLLKLGWSFAQYTMDDTAVRKIWESLAAVIAKKRLRPRTYLVDTVKHLIYIGIGSLPGFRAADLSETVIPSYCIQDAYINIYGLKDYIPLIIHPHICAVRVSRFLFTILWLTQRY